MRDKGFTLIFVIFLIAALIACAAAGAAIMMGLTKSLFSRTDYYKAYYLAEAGIEYGKAELLSHPDWNTPGTRINAPTGYFVMKREPAKPFLTSDGFSGRSHVIIRLDVIDHSTYIQREE